jgi:hypothetical protein
MAFCSSFRCVLLWSSETPWRWVREAMRDSVSPCLTLYYSAPSGNAATAILGSTGTAAGAAGCTAPPNGAVRDAARFPGAVSKFVTVDALGSVLVLLASSKLGWLKNLGRVILHLMAMYKTGNNQVWRVLFEIAKLLNVDAKELLVTNK